jgi:hypothetical protein
MAWILTKYLITAVIVVAASELAKRSDRIGALVGSLPLVTILALVWLHVEKQPEAKVASHAWYTFWYVLPTLPMFLAFPPLYERFGFWSSLGMCGGITVGCFVLITVAVRRFGIDLLP